MRKETDIFRSRIPSLREASPGRELVSLFSDFFGGDNLRPSSTLPAVDVSEVDDHFLISVDVPGVDEDDIQVMVENNQLTIRAERTDEREESGKNRQWSERYYGIFERTFTLPLSADTEKIEANYEKGVLQIAIPKGESSKARQVNVAGGKSGLFDRLLGSRSKKGDREENVRKVSNQ